MGSIRTMRALRSTRSNKSMWSIMPIRFLRLTKLIWFTRPPGLLRLLGLLGPLIGLLGPHKLSVKIFGFLRMNFGENF